MNPVELNLPALWLLTLALVVAAPLFDGLMQACAARFIGRRSPWLRPLADLVARWQMPAPACGRPVAVGAPVALAATVSASLIAAHFALTSRIDPAIGFAFVGLVTLARAAATIGRLEVVRPGPGAFGEPLVGQFLATPILLLALLAAAAPDGSTQAHLGHALAAVAFVIGILLQTGVRAPVGPLHGAPARLPAGPRGACLVLAEQLGQLVGWTTWASVFLPWRALTGLPRAAGCAVAVVLIAVILGALDGLALERQRRSLVGAPAYGLALAVVALLLSSIAGGQP